MSDIKVNLVGVTGKVLKEHTFKLVDGKFLPINQICKLWSVKDLKWFIDADILEPLPASAQTGNSEMSFASMKSINITGTYL